MAAVLEDEVLGPLNITFVLSYKFEKKPYHVFFMGNMLLCMYNKNGSYFS